MIHSPHTANYGVGWLDPQLQIYTHSRNIVIYSLPFKPDWNPWQTTGEKANPLNPSQVFKSYCQPASYGLVENAVT